MMFDQRLKVLHATQFFGAVPEEDLKALAETMLEELFSEGEIVCRRGEPADRIFIVMSGRLAIEDLGIGAAVPDLRPGALFGEYGMFDNAQRSATITAREPSVLLSLDYRRFRAFLLMFPDTMLAIFSTTVRQLLSAQRKLR